jgi:ArsR family transcriptional regulator
MHRHLSMGEFAMPTRTATVASAPAVECCPSVLASPLNAFEAAELSAGFSALGDPMRLMILSLLAAAPSGEVCVCDFVQPLGKSQPTVSHHLKILAEADLVTSERRGKWVYYALNGPRLDRLQAALNA